MNAIESIKHILLQSGSTWILWFLGILSVISVMIIVERALFYRSKGGDLGKLAERLDLYLSEGQFIRAIEEFGESPSLASAIAVAGIRLADCGPEAADKAMTSAVALEREKLEKWLAYLGTVGNNAPFVGLFGTVIGVIGAFEELGRSSSGKAAAAAASTASQAVMASIAEALVATALGILVALPAVAAYNYFQRKMASLLLGTDVLSNIVLAYLSERRSDPLATEPAGSFPSHQSSFNSTLHT